MKIQAVIAVFIIILVLGGQSNVAAQNYIGIGWHLGMPVKFDNCCIPLFQANPIPVSSFSLTYKKELVNKRKRKLYYEMGLTTAGFGYNEVEHDNDTRSGEYPPWGIFKISQPGFASLLFGSGRYIPLKNGHEFVLGLEASLRVSNTVSGFGSNDFVVFSADKIKYPIFLRANLGYAIPLKLLKQIPSQLLFYTKVSAQNIAEGAQYITDSSTGVTNRDGKYRLNNSEAGIQFYINIDKESYNFSDKPPRVRKPRVKRTGKRKVKFSVEAQVYSSRPTQYFMPHVDSFTVRSMKVLPMSQIGVKMEFAPFKNPNWSTVVAFGTGRIDASVRFTADAAYASTSNDVEPPALSTSIGRYLIQNIGIAYKKDWGKLQLQHTLTACAVEPIEKYTSEYTYSIGSNFQNPIFKGEFYEKYPHDKLALGLEYNPELLLNTHKRVFLGLGIVFNYSWGVLAQGRAYVTNGTTPYYGGMLQRFSKIGFTARLGFQSRRSALEL